MAFTSTASHSRSVLLHGRRLGLTVEERMRVAAETVRELRKHGEWHELDEPRSTAARRQLTGPDKDLGKKLSAVGHGLRSFSWCVVDWVS